MSKQCYVWDFTLWYESRYAVSESGEYILDDSTTETISEIKDTLNDLCKSWTFQLEKGKQSSKTHFQGRISLKTKKTQSSLGKILKGWHISPTSNVNKDNVNYVIKLDTRIAGPWSNTDKIVKIPRDLKEIKELYPWQKSLEQELSFYHPRRVDVLYNNGGNIGKSLFSKYMLINHNAVEMPPFNDFKDLIQCACCAFNDKEPNIVLIDMPRAINKEKLYGLYSAIERIKDGKAYDTRYHFKTALIDPPRVIVFTNELPNENLLSKDRWKFWEVIDNELVKYMHPEDREWDENMKLILNETLNQEIDDDGIIYD